MFMRNLQRGCRQTSCFPLFPVVMLTGETNLLTPGTYFWDRDESGINLVIQTKYFWQVLTLSSHLGNARRQLFKAKKTGPLPK